MFKDQLNSKKQGDVGLGMAISWFVQNGYTICIPLTDSQDYDLVVEKDEGLKKVQIKTTYCKNKYGRYQVSLKTCGGNKSSSKTKFFDSNESDYLFIITEDGDKYMIPREKLKARSGIVIGKDKEIYRV